MCVEDAGSEGREEAYPAGGIAELEGEEYELFAIVSKDELPMVVILPSTRRGNVCIP
jgi:hypothetical protein